MGENHRRAAQRASERVDAQAEKQIGNKVAFIHEINRLCSAGMISAELRLRFHDSLLGEHSQRPLSEGQYRQTTKPRIRVFSVRTKNT